MINQLRSVLSVEKVVEEAAAFCHLENTHKEPSLYGVDNGKTVGTYLEHKFVAHLMDKYDFAGGNSALGIDIPSVGVDIKVTSVRQPQSSCPYKSARQKIFGLGYHLIVFVYDKQEDHQAKATCMNMQHAVFINRAQTGDYQMTRGLREILQHDGNEEELIAFMSDRNLPVDDIEATSIATQLLKETPAQGYLTISNALQWRLQYGRAIQVAGEVEGVTRIR